MSTAINPSSGDQPTTPGAGRPVGATGSQTHRELTERQREQFGGMKFGASFFGWLSATGMVVLLIALITAVGAVFGATGVNFNQVSSDPLAAGLAGGITLLVVIFIAYFCGGYVAGRMSRFNGLKQGLGVWLWAIIVAVVLTILGLIAGSRLQNMPVSGLPQLPADAMNWSAVLVVVAVLVVSLIGALLGGLAGMRYHRRVDRVAGTD
jgi:membrane protease YdiL (CAAX protease family)